MNAYEEWRKGFEAGYFYGRIDAVNGREYDGRTPKERYEAEKAALVLSDGDAVTCKKEGADGCES
ncbi:hypothetical protein D3C74_293430 [compost metagenome]